MMWRHCSKILLKSALMHFLVEFIYNAIILRDKKVTEIIWI